MSSDCTSGEAPLGPFFNLRRKLRRPFGRGRSSHPRTKTRSSLSPFMFFQHSQSQEFLGLKVDTTIRAAWTSSASSPPRKRRRRTKALPPSTHSIFGRYQFLLIVDSQCLFWVRKRCLCIGGLHCISKRMVILGDSVSLTSTLV